MAACGCSSFRSLLAGVFFYKYVLKDQNGKMHWQEGANNLLVLPDSADIPEDSFYVVDDCGMGMSAKTQEMVLSS